jgi:saccharopine dehydrogenase-like NADP-dependent oxidoreductase
MLSRAAFERTTLLPMQKIAVLGAGRVGTVIAADLCAHAKVTLADSNPAALALAKARCEGRARIRRADLANPRTVRALAESHDLVVGALPSRLGFQALRSVLEVGRSCVDISFMPEDARALDGLAREHGATALVDLGVAPGMSHLLAAEGVRRLGGADRVRILVGGVPRDPKPPFLFKAAFAPADVIEEYTRPARLVEGGRVVERPALSHVEQVELPGVGRMEGGLTDGLRSLVTTLQVPDMIELTLRWPGHYDLMRGFQGAGLFSTEPLDVGGARVRPLDVTTALLVSAWTYAEGEEDLTVLRVEVEHKGRRMTWDLVDQFDKATSTSSMARTTAFPCAIAARLLAEGSLRAPGVHPPENLAAMPGVLEHLLAEHARRGVAYRAESR